MNSEKQNSNFSEIPQDAVVFLNKVGFGCELIQDKIASVSPDFSHRFHQELMNSKIFPSWDGSTEWFTTGVRSQILNPGEQWKKGHFRLRIMAEFLPDEPETSPADRPSENLPETAIEEPSLDAFRESP